jgi:hypothetical protein
MAEREPAGCALLQESSLMNERPPSVLLLGDLEAGDIRSILEIVRSWKPEIDTRTTANFAEFRKFVGRDLWFPDLVVVLQSWPDQFSETDVHDILALCPLARIACCFGPWCDSDGRTRSIWPLALRVPVAAAVGRLARELALLESGDAPRRPLSLTASRAEIFEYDFCPWEPEEPAARTVTVISPDRRWKEMIESGIRKFGLRNHDPRSGEPPEILIFDADPWDAEQAISLRAIRAADRKARIIAAIGFPRPDLETALHESGADQVWFKLAPIADLFVVPPSGGSGGVPPSGRTTIKG